MLRQFFQAGAAFVPFLVLILVLIAAAVPAPALAQSPNPNLGPGIDINPEQQATPEQIQRRKANDAAYDAAMKKIPDKKASSDPWGDIRPAAPARNKPQQ